jgi:DNA-directed RNA polymerase specialized sigma24 family protein
MAADNDDLAYLRKVGAATVLLLLEQRTPENEAGMRAELLLANAGFSVGEIAELVGKQPGAIRMAMSRARKAKRGDDG